MSENFIDQQVEHFQGDKDNNDPFQEGAVTILQQVLKQLQVFFDDLQPFTDVPEPFLQIEGPFQPEIDTVEVLILPGLRGRIENIQILGDPVLQIEGLADVFLQIVPR